MKPDWCDEATWRDAAKVVFSFESDVQSGRFSAFPNGDDASRHLHGLIARALIAAKNEGLELAAQVAHDTPHANDDPRGPLYATGWTSACRTITAAIRSRIQKE